MDFLKKIFPIFQQKENKTKEFPVSDRSLTTVITSTNDNLCDEIMKDSTTYSENPIVIDEHKKIDPYENEAMSITSADNISEMVDFEELIDSTQKPDEVKKTLENIMEFETELQTVTLTEMCNNNVTNILNLDDIDELFEKVDTENNDVKPQIIEQNNANIDSGNLNKCDESSIQLIKKENIVAFIDLLDSSQETHSNTDEEEKKVELHTEDSKEVLQEIISISSNESENSDDGYNSSDFEFITETEAKMDGFIINFNNNNPASDDINNNMLKNVSSDDHSNFNGYNSLPMTQESNEDPGEGCSGLNNHKGKYNMDYREHHIIPEGDGYLNLFQGPYNPVMPMSDIVMLENKSIRPSPMNAQYEGIGFEKQLIVHRFQPDSSEEEYADEAKASIEKILSMYPQENRKRSRRRRF